MKRYMFCFAVFLCAWVQGQTLTWQAPLTNKASNVLVSIYTSTNITQPLKSWKKCAEVLNPTNNFVSIQLTNKVAFFSAVAVYYNLGVYIPSSVSLSWEEPLGSPFISGYNIYSGASPLFLSQALRLSKTNNVTISNLTQRTYFAATTTNIFGQESDRTSVVVFLPNRQTNIVASTPLKLAISLPKSNVANVPVKNTKKSSLKRNKIELPPIPGI